MKHHKYIYETNVFAAGYSTVAVYTAPGSSGAYFEALKNAKPMTPEKVMHFWETKAVHDYFHPIVFIIAIALLFKYIRRDGEICTLGHSHEENEKD